MIEGNLDYALARVHARHGERLEESDAHVRVPYAARAMVLVEDRERHGPTAGCREDEAEHADQNDREDEREE